MNIKTDRGNSAVLRRDEIYFYVLCNSSYFSGFAFVASTVGFRGEDAWGLPTPRFGGPSVQFKSSAMNCSEKQYSIFALLGALHFAFRLMCILLVHTLIL